MGQWESWLWVTPSTPSHSLGCSPSPLPCKSAQLTQPWKRPPGDTPLSQNFQEFRGQGPWKNSPVTCCLGQLPHVPPWPGRAHTRKLGAPSRGRNRAPGGKGQAPLPGFHSAGWENPEQCAAENSLALWRLGGASSEEAVKRP